MLHNLVPRAFLARERPCERGWHVTVKSFSGDLLYLYCALFMYDYYSKRLPLILNDFFKSINKVHQYQTRLASKISYYLPKLSEDQLCQI